MSYVKSTTDPRQIMVDQQLAARGIHDARVLEAMGWIPRERFMPEEAAEHAYDDAAAPIGHGQTISQPYIVALMTQALEIAPTHRVLEVGTGSGYQAAVLAHLAKTIYTVERIKPLLDLAFEHILALHLRNVRFKFADGSIGWCEEAPFDRIMVTAAAPDVPQELIDQLAEDGQLIAPIGSREDQQLVKVIRRPHGNIERVHLGGCRFVPLIGQRGWNA